MKLTAKEKKEKFWALPQLSRVEYLLVMREMKEQSQVGVTFAIARILVFVIAYMLALILIVMNLDRPDLLVSLAETSRSLVKMLGIGLVIGIILDVIFAIKETKKYKEINRRFFNEKKESTASVQDLQQEHQ